jgi:hypothetical protein
MGKDQHVVPNGGNGWKVEGEGNSKATAITNTKAEAVKIADKIAENQKSETVIHGKDGQIQNSNSHGNDPCPPKDKKH